MSLIVARDVSVNYGPRRVLSGANLSVEPGEFLGLIGPNGDGKTTLMRALLGLVVPTEGTVTVAGKQGSAVREAIGYVPQRHEVAWDFPIDIYSMVLNLSLIYI